MNSLPKQKQHDAPAQEATEEAVQEAIEDYLDYLCAPLLGIASYAQRRRLRLEAADHLYALTEDFQAEGFAPPDAVRLALREYGEPWAVGQSVADTCLGGTASYRWGRCGDAATLRAFGVFGVFTVLTLLLLETSLLQPGASWAEPYAVCLAVISPVLAGILTGLGGHGRATSGIFRAVGTLAAASGVAGLLLLPHFEGLQFALFQLLFWLPVGTLSSAVTSGLARQFRLRRFPRTTC